MITLKIWLSEKRYPKFNLGQSRKANPASGYKESNEIDKLVGEVLNLDLQNSKQKVYNLFVWSCDGCLTILMIAKLNVIYWGRTNIISLISKSCFKYFGGAREIMLQNSVCWW